MQKKLYKSATDRKICGVCGGIAEYFGIDPTLVRIGAVVLTLLTAVATGIIAYVVCAAIIPEKTTVV